MSTKYERPILTSIFYALGGLALIGAVICLATSLTEGITIALIGIIYFGIAQAVDYLARAAHSTDRLCTILETSITERLKSIESSLSPATPLTVRIDSTPPPRSIPTRQQAAYYFSADGTQQGPLAASDLKNMRKDGLIADDTPVLREGESQWRAYRDCLELNR